MSSFAEINRRVGAAMQLDNDNLHSVRERKREIHKIDIHRKRIQF